MDHSLSSSGVRISADFRDNLIIDRYDPIFVSMRASKIKHFRSENSEDAVTWNVFRSLRQVDPASWLPSLVQRGFPEVTLSNARVAVNLWVSVAPPSSLLDTGDEGASEIDVVIESPEWVWFVEAKYRSDISTGTTTRPDRDQIIRNIDVGSYYAGVRRFYFSLLIAKEQHSRAGVETARKYSSDFALVRNALKNHRPDGLANLRGIGILTWHDLVSVLADARSTCRRDDERGYADRAIKWLESKGFEATPPSAAKPTV
jgi:hypothetical protein